MPDLLAQRGFSDDTPSIQVNVSRDTARPQSLDSMSVDADSTAFLHSQAHQLIDRHYSRTPRASFHRRAARRFQPHRLRCLDSRTLQEKQPGRMPICPRKSFPVPPLGWMETMGHAMGPEKSIG